MAVFPGGENTLTKEGVPDVLLEALLDRRPKTLNKLLRGTSKDPSYISAQRMVRRVLRSPVLRKVFCRSPNFTLNPVSKIVARVGRKELGDFDALMLGLFLMANFEGQIVVPDFGFYGREGHVLLVREGRLIAGVNVLSELPPKLRQTLLIGSER